MEGGEGGEGGGRVRFVCVGPFCTINTMFLNEKGWDPNLEGNAGGQRREGWWRGEGRMRERGWREEEGIGLFLIIVFSLFIFL